MQLQVMKVPGVAQVAFVSGQVTLGPSVRPRETVVSVMGSSLSRLSDYFLIERVFVAIFSPSSSNAGHSA